MQKIQRFTLLIALYGLSLTLSAHAEEITVAAAADLKFAMDEIVTNFEHAHPSDTINVVYGSSGKFRTQIAQGAPYDLYFSADIQYAQSLVDANLASSSAQPYAFGRIVLWANTMDATKMTLASLIDSKITRIAIANPQHAPYGKRAEEALRASGMWKKIQHKLVYGENIASTAQYVQTGNVEVGIIALSLAVNPQLSNQGGYYLISDQLHEPLKQGFIITKHGENRILAKRYADYIGSDAARNVMKKYGFVLPHSTSGKLDPGNEQRK